MNIFKKVYCRVFQKCFWIAMPMLPYTNPVVKHKLEDIVDIVKENGIKKPMLITDKNLSKLGAVDGLKEILKSNKIEFYFFDEAFPNPTTELARQALDRYNNNKCDALIAFGGGSPMDLAKAVGVGVARPKKSLEQLGGILKVRKKIPTLIAVPTTAGTGSETTVTSVLINDMTRHKFAINDFPLIPKYAILDPVTIHSLPTSIAAATGLDALTHAVEAYIGLSTTRQTRRDSEKAVELIFKYFDNSCNHKSSKAEREMLIASHYAGRAFTRSYVGYVHAISHSLSGQYDLPHGWTNAVLLPLLLREYGECIHKKLAKLAVCAGLGEASEDNAVLAERFIAAVEDMKKRYDIPEKISGINPDDIPRLAKYADKEANPLYPVPILWNAKELERLYHAVRE